MVNWIVFLDRDWVINIKAEENDYIKSREGFSWCENIREFIKKCNDNNLLVIVISNQQWIWKWLYSIEILNEIHRNINQDLKKYDAHIDMFYFCPHLITENCECRKPKIWMFEKACEDFWFFDKSKMFFIWDSDSDIEAWKNFLIKSIKIESNNFIFSDLIKI
jgi:D-glycero-D-manno-heptose 1,7-bisphosphate phosphatase